MKKLLFLIPAVALLLFALSLAVLEGAATAVLQQLDIPEQIARDCVWSSFTGMYLSYPNPQKLRLTPVEKRAAFVREIVQWARAYTQSEEFMGRYREYRETVKPAPPGKPKTMDEIRRESLEQIRNSIRETEENLKNLPAEQQAMMRDVIKTMREQEQSLADPNNPMFSRDMDAMQNQAYAEEMERFKAKLAEWDRDYPADTATPMIRRWLTEFLRVSEGIDFDARLTTNKYGRKVFADPALEQRSSNWKLCYRAGKETVEGRQGLCEPVAGGTERLLPLGRTRTRSRPREASGRVEQWPAAVFFGVDACRMTDWHGSPPQGRHLPAVDLHDRVERAKSRRQ